MEKQEKPTYAEFIKRSHINSYSEFVEISKTVNDAVKNKKDEEFINEGEEVSPDAIMDSKTKKKLKTFFEENVTGIDSMSFKKDGTILAKSGYYYKHGNDETKVANKLKSALEKAGFEIEIIKAYDDFKPWPKDSNFVVIFKIKSVS